MIKTIDLSVHRHGAMAVVAVRGDLDMATAPCLRDQLGGLLDAGAIEITLDLAQLDFIDSTGLHVMMSALTRLRAEGGDLVLRGVTTRATKVLELTGLAGVFHLADSPETPQPDPLRSGKAERTSRRMAPAD